MTSELWWYYYKKIMTPWRLRWWVAFLSSEIFLNWYIHWFFLDVMLLHNKLQYSVNITFMCWKTKKIVTHVTALLSLLWWFGTEPTVSLRYVCSLKPIPRSSSYLFLNLKFYIFIFKITVEKTITVEMEDMPEEGSVLIDV